MPDVTPERDASPAATPQAAPSVGDRAYIDLHLANLAANLQLIADLGYGAVMLAVPAQGAALRVIADARPMTAVTASAVERHGETLRHENEPEAYKALSSGETFVSERRRVARGHAFATYAYPVPPGGRDGAGTYAVMVRDVAQLVLEAPGRMEQSFMRAAEELIGLLQRGPLLDLHSGESFSTIRVAGDGVLRVADSGVVSYASPNAVNIMRLAGIEGSLTGKQARRLPGAETAVVPVLGTTRGLETEVAANGRVLVFRSIGLGGDAILLVEDVTDARRREQEIKVKEATIREVHHRVKNNLQTIASLLRIQSRRLESEEAQHALDEAVERVSSMAVVHELLAGSTEERIDFAEAAQTVVDMVRRGLAGESAGVRVTVVGSLGLVPAHVATSLALVITELVHNAIEHGFPGGMCKDPEIPCGTVSVEMRRLRGELLLTVRDDGTGLPVDFDAHAASTLGLAIVRTIVADDLRGTLSFASNRGTTVTVRVPMAPEPDQSTDDVKES